jgi:hypothetical protein
MSRTHLFLAASALALIASAVARAASPSISFTVDSFYLGSAVTFSPTVTDADADMDYATFQVTGPGTSGWLTLSPDVTVPGAGTSAQQSGVVVQKAWTPSQPGLWTVRVTVHSLNGSNSLDRTFDVLAGTRIINPITVQSGTSQVFTYDGELVTATNTTADSVIAQSGGSMIIWSGGRVKLEPGFHAFSGTNSIVWATVDHDMNGYSDMEEATDTDGDGMPDAWEVDHGLNPIVNDANGDLDGDGTSNLAEYLVGRDPNNKADATALPSGYQVVLRTPTGTYYGVSTSWALSTVPSP